ncbi:Uncharacterised protein [uncultured archaeon]|nr:Uncharacterised protein [uncultured archaeon]
MPITTVGHAPRLQDVPELDSSHLELLWRPDGVIDLGEMPSMVTVLDCLRKVERASCEAGRTDPDSVAFTVKGRRHALSKKDCGGSERVWVRRSANPDSEGFSRSEGYSEYYLDRL